MKKPTTTKKEVTAQEHFRLRLPSEKPTREDADSDGGIIIFLKDGTNDTWSWSTSMNPDRVLCWLPGHLPQHLIPKPESAEDRMRREFEEWAKGEAMQLQSPNGITYSQPFTQSAWLAWQAAKKGVQA